MEPVVLQDPRLEGWKQDVELQASPGSYIRIVSIEHGCRGEPGDVDFDEWLTVHAALVVDGSEEPLPLPVFFRRADDKRLRTLGHFEAALKSNLRDADRAVDAEDLARLVQLEEVFEPLEIDSAAGIVGGLHTVLAELREKDPALAERMHRLFDNAYQAGWSVATWQFAERFGGDVRRTRKRSNSARPGGRVTGKRNAAAARVRYEKAWPWVQGLIDVLIKEHSRSPTQAEVAYAMEDSWASGPFSEFPKAYDHGYLKRLISSWEEKNHISRSLNARDHAPAAQPTERR